MTNKSCGNVCSMSLVLLLSAQLAYGQNARLRTSSLNMGYASSSTGNTTVKSTAGQAIIGDAERDDTRLRGGFLSLGAMRKQGTVRIDSISGIGIERESLRVNITLPLGIAPVSGRIFYRRGGEDGNAYASDSLIPNGNTLGATIPDSYVTIRGIEYYGVLRIGQTTQIFPEGRSRTNPAPLRVRISQKTRTDITRLKYKMISLPIDTLTRDQAQVFSVLGDDFGEYRRNYWRVFRWANGAYVEHPSIQSMFNPGNAFWLITHGGTQYDVDSGLSVNTAAPYPIQLPARDYAQISNPFPFPVSWGAIRTPGVKGLYHFNGVGYDLDTSAGALLQPWDGYFVKNENPSPATLNVSPVEVPSTPVANTTGQTPFAVRLSLTAGELADANNYLGFHPNATDGYDDLDYPKPPMPPGGGVYLAILQDGMECMISSQTPTEIGKQWDVLVRSNDGPQASRILVELHGEMPAGLHVYLYDIREDRVVLCDGGLAALDVGQTERRLKAIVGTPAYARGMLGDIPLEPIEFTLRQNYPNPFNPQTTIRYQVAKRSHVRLEIFNILGQRIVVLVDEEHRTGFHSIVWNGRNGESSAVGSGVYLYRMMAGDFVDTKKLMLVR